MSPRAKDSAAASAADEGGEWLRARRPEQKLERRAAILAAAVELLDQGGVEGATLSAIAAGAGLSKANCYRYFESREAILLAVALEEFRQWIAATEAGFAKLGGSGDIDAVAAVIARVTARRPRLCMLVSSLTAVLERNVAVDTVAAFKLETARLQGRAAEALARALPPIRAADAAVFLRLYMLGLAGAWPAANPSPVVVEAMARPEIATAPVSLETMLRTLGATLLRGLVASAGGDAAPSPKKRGR